MKCPRDYSELQPDPTGISYLHTCPSCKGAFIQLDKCVDPSLSMERIKPYTRSRISVSDDKRTISPSSGKPMLLFSFQGVQIDYCIASNSVWLDDGELKKITSAKTPPESIDPSDHDIIDIKANLLANDSGLFEFIGNAIAGIFDL